MTSSRKASAGLWPVETIIVLQQISLFAGMIAGALLGMSINLGLVYAVNALLFALISVVSYYWVYSIKKTQLIPEIPTFPGKKVWF